MINRTCRIRTVPTKKPTVDKKIRRIVHHVFIAICGIAIIPSQLGAQSGLRSVSFDKSIIEMKSVAPDDEDFSDLVKFGEMIGDSRVVQLGEFSHGDGKAFEARIRLVKFLHQKLGFNVLAFESGLLEVEKAQADLKLGKSSHRAVSSKIYDAWANSRQAMPLFDYLKRSYTDGRPLEFVGFDPQFSSDTSNVFVEEFLGNFLDKLPDSKFSKSDRHSLHKMLNVLQRYGATKIDNLRHRENQQLIRRLISVARAPVNPKAGKLITSQMQWFLQVVKNIEAMEEAIYYRSMGPNITLENINTAVNSPELITASNIRDRQMANNILFLLDQYKKRYKVITWGANSHLANISQRTSTPQLSKEQKLLRYVPMGEHLKKFLGDELFTVLSVSFAGEWALAGVSYQKGTYQPARPNTLAYLLHKEKLDVAFLDLEAFYRKNRGNNNMISVRDGWTVEKIDDLRKVCDALLYFDEMNPSTMFTDSQIPH